MQTIIDPAHHKSKSIAVKKDKKGIKAKANKKNNTKPASRLHGQDTLK